MTVLFVHGMITFHTIRRSGFTPHLSRTGNRRTSETIQPVTMPSPKISIITPTFNAADTIEACMESVARQSWADREHLFIDNVSTDGTPDIIRKHADAHRHIRLVSEKDSGIYDALNKGIDLCQGEWLFFLGSDDTLADADVLKSIFSQTGTEQQDIIYGNVEWGKGGSVYDGQFTLQKLLNRNICHQSIFFRRDIFSRLGKFDTKYRILSDWVFNMKWFCNQDIRRRYVDRVIAVYNPEGYSSKHHDTAFIADQAELVGRFFPEEYATIFRLQQTIREFSLETERKNEEISRLFAAIGWKEQENDTLNARVDSLHADIETLQTGIADLEEKLNKVLNSSSWKITKPIRNLSKSFRKRSRALRGKGRSSPEEKKREGDDPVNLSIFLHEFQPLAAGHIEPCTENVDILILTGSEEAHALSALLDSIHRNTAIPYRLVVISSGGEDTAGQAVLDAFDSGKHPLTVLSCSSRPDVLKSLSLARKHLVSHVILLHDVPEVPPGWAERMIRPLVEHEKIAIATPFTGSLGVCGFPELSAIHGVSPDALDSSFRAVTPKSYFPNIPEGMSFCAALHREVISQANGISGAPPFTIRATAKGYRHVLVPNLFIPLTVPAPSPGAAESLPDAGSDPLAKIRKFILFTLLASDAGASGCTLFIDHDLGGGANLYREKFIRTELERGGRIILFTFNYAKKTYEIRLFHEQTAVHLFSRTLEDIRTLLTTYAKIGRICLSQTVSFRNTTLLLNTVLDLQEAHQARLTLFIHDYQCICPSFHLLDHTMTFCGPPEEISTCMHCLPENHGEFRTFFRNSDIMFWRKKWKSVLDRCDEIVCFSQSSKQLILRAYPHLDAGRILVRPHTVDHLPPIRAGRRVRNEDASGHLTIGVLGNINIPKGYTILADMARIIEEEKKDISIVVIGKLIEPVDSSHVTVTGKYRHEELPELIEKNRIDLFLTPSICPETFSYTSEEIIRLGYPLAVFNLGAPAERVQNSAKGLVITAIDARTALEEMSAFHRRTIGHGQPATLSHDDN